MAWLLVVFLFGMAAASTWFFGSVRTVNIALILMGQVASWMFLNRTQMHMAQAMHLRDATQRLKAQLDRDLGQDRFLRLFQSSPTPIFVQSSRAGAILDVNQAFERTLGHARKDVLNRRDGFLWLQDEEHQRSVRDRRASRRTGWQPAGWRRSDGRGVEVLVSREPNEDPGGLLILTTVVDAPDNQNAGDAFSA